MTIDTKFNARKGEEGYREMIAERVEEVKRRESRERERVGKGDE